jgi:hypothetical protein
MTIIESARPIQQHDPALELDEAQLAAASFLARYSGRTLEAYRRDLRGFFQWAAGHGVVVSGATRPHIELFRAWMGERGSPLRRSTVAVDSVCLLPVCSQRRSDRREPCPVSPTCAGPGFGRGRRSDLAG